MHKIRRWSYGLLISALEPTHSTTLFTASNSDNQLLAFVQNSATSINCHTDTTFQSQRQWGVSTEVGAQPAPSTTCSST